MTDQDKDYEYFTRNMENLYKLYGRKFLSLKGERVLGAYDSFKEAFEKTRETEKMGTFLIQECFKNRSEAIRHFQTNVVIHA
jgi:hypothetical protein